MNQLNLGFEHTFHSVLNRKACTKFLSSPTTVMTFYLQPKMTKSQGILKVITIHPLEH